MVMVNNSLLAKTAFASDYECRYIRVIDQRCYSESTRIQEVENYGTNERTVAQQLQLYIEYAPEPPFNSGTPKTAPLEVLQATRDSFREISEARLATAKRIARKLVVASSLANAG